ncbi:sugar phosphate nucleotidyltransferase [Shigella flexneri]
MKCLSEQDTVAFEVAQFIENRIWKPPRPMWQGRIFWNSGMFLFRAGRYLEELKNIGRISSMPRKSDRAVNPISISRAMKKRFSPARRVGGYAVMNIRQMPLWCDDVGWSDVGSWSSLWGDQCPHRRGQRLPRRCD